MPFDRYFDRRSNRFAAFYRSEPVARILGRGALFDRLRFAVDTAVAVGAQRVLDIGCGSGPLFEPLASRGIRVIGIDPAPGMVELARREAERFPGLVEVRVQRWEEVDDRDEHDVAVALGVFDYVEQPAELLGVMRRAAPHVVGSFPAPGLRMALRRVRYGARGVAVYGYSRERVVTLAEEADLAVAQVRRMGRAGYAVHLRRP